MNGGINNRERRGKNSKKVLGNEGKWSRRRGEVRLE